MMRRLNAFTIEDEKEIPAPELTARAFRQFTIPPNVACDCF
jgi:hypothetical protein